MTTNDLLNSIMEAAGRIREHTDPEIAGVSFDTDALNKSLKEVDGILWAEIDILEGT